MTATPYLVTGARQIASSNVGMCAPGVMRPKRTLAGRCAEMGRKLDGKNVTTGMRRTGTVAARRATWRTGGRAPCRVAENRGAQAFVGTGCGLVGKSATTGTGPGMMDAQATVRWSVASIAPGGSPGA